jgi:hypothetical protein
MGGLEKGLSWQWWAQCNLGSGFGIRNHIHNPLSWFCPYVGVSAIGLFFCLGHVIFVVLISGHKHGIGPSRNDRELCRWRTSMAQLRVDLALLMGKGPSGSDQKKKVGPKRDKKAGKILVLELLFRWASEHTHNVWG